jgi:hypothetical protein
MHASIDFKQYNGQSFEKELLMRHFGSASKKISIKKDSKDNIESVPMSEVDVTSTRLAPTQGHSRQVSIMNVKTK